MDVSKGYADFLLLDSNSKVLEETFKLPDNKQGRKKLKELISGWQQQGIEELYCGVESTGGYEDNWYSYLKSGFKERKVYVCRINPRGVKAIGEASLKRTITDAVSAENIASYMILFPQKTDYGIDAKPVDERYKEGRQHLTCIKMQVKQRVQLNNQLEKLIYQYFGEMMVYCRHGTPDWLLGMLVRYPTAEMVIKAGAAGLCTINGITPEKAVAILGKARENIRQAGPHIGHVMVVLAKEMLHKAGLVKDEKKYLAQLYENNEEVKLLVSIPGVATDSAVAIVLEIEDVTKFDSAKKMASFFGVHPVFKESGDGRWGNHMSKKGRGEIRAVLYMAALTAVRCNPDIKQLYARFRSQGMNHYQAAGVVMHKLLRMIYGMLRNKTKFSAATDKANQENADEKQQKKQEKDKADKKVKQLKRHRFEVITDDAPISRRAQQKLKKQAASQTSS